MPRRKKNMGTDSCDDDMRVMQIRLKQARQREKLSMEELVERMGKEAVSKQSISKFENGVTYPTSRTLVALAKALNVTTDYFFRPLTYNVNKSNISFRTKSSIGAKEEKSLKVKIQEEVERNLEIDAILDEGGKPNGLPKSTRILRTKTDMLNLAKEVRDDWKLGIQPISNVRELLKAKGIKVFEVNGADGFDGVCGKVDDSSWFIVLNADVTHVERKRLTLLHEFCHLIANDRFDPEMTEYTREQMCNAFAGAVLLPEEIREAVYRHKNGVTVSTLVYGQETFGISPDAIMKTLNNAGIINDDRYRNYNVRKNKDHNLKTILTQTRFREQGGDITDIFQNKVYKALALGYINEEKAAELLQCDIEEVKKNNTIV